MTLAAVSPVAALLPIMKEDSLSRDEKHSRNMLMLSLLNACEDGTALDYFVSNQKVIAKYTPAKLVSLFPEKEFTALTLIEYILNYVKFIMDDPKEFMLDVSDVMEYWNSTISAVKELLKESSLLDKEQALRVEACYKDIDNAVQLCKQLRENGGNSDDTETADSKSWPPFFTTNFSSDNEKKFMTRVRELYITKRMLATANIFQDLEDLCNSTDLGHVTSSDVQTNTAMQIMIALVFPRIDKFCSNDLKPERYTFLLSSFDTLNGSSFPLSTISVGFQTNAVLRIKRIQGFMERCYGDSTPLPKFVGYTTRRPQKPVRGQKRCIEVDDA